MLSSSSEHTYMHTYHAAAILLQFCNDMREEEKEEDIEVLELKVSACQESNPNHQEAFHPDDRKN
jgi:hypothetical protein